MLPFDNKSEFQIILNMPEGSSLERTAEAAREIAAAVRTEPEVTDYEIYAGVASPFNFNGLVRHYFMRRGANVADLQVNLLPKGERKAQSHDVAKRVRPRVAGHRREIRRAGGRGRSPARPAGACRPSSPKFTGPTRPAAWRWRGRSLIFSTSTPGVVDTDWYIEADQPKVRFVIDKEKAALHGISAETISETLRIAVGGESVDLLHVPREKEDVNIVLQLPLASRTSPEELLALRVRSGDANALPEPGSTTGVPPLIPLRELVTVERTITDKSIYHKNLMPVTYVIGDVAGRGGKPGVCHPENEPGVEETGCDEFVGVAADVSPRQTSSAWTGCRASRAQLHKIYNAVQPFTDQQPSLKWDGEWHITIEVFRDLGLAFAAVLVLIYILMVGWFRSFLTPLIVMTVIPFSLVGILPAHGALHAFFTATSMIGFMAGAGIVVRNSIILVDFIEQRLARRPAAGRGGGRGGHGPLPADPADGAGGGGGGDGDFVRPDFPGPGDFADGGQPGFDDHRAGGRAAAVFHGQRPESRR